jgi:small-conductance mechanosensitive channel
LLESRIQNFKSMWQRRVVLRFSARANTPPEILESIPGWIKVFVTAEPKLRLDRCHLAAISALSMDFELVFFVLDSDYGFYMDVQQRIFLQVLRKFRAEGVEFALPEQRVRVESETRSPDIAGPLPGE